MITRLTGIAALTVCMMACTPAAPDAAPGASPDTAPQASTPAAPAPAGDTTDASPSTVAYQRVNDTMHAGMATGFTGDADVDFMRGMIPHHQGAIDMAHVVLEHGQDAEVSALAQQVIAAQEEEIAMMRRWLDARGASVGVPDATQAPQHSHH